ncbi:MAG: hypothetical protein IPJ79_15630 [Bacteroidetes bacterium]|nr:hypothetical protein [Bacteroidota bacterium]
MSSKIYNKLSKSYDQLFKENILAFNENMQSHPSYAKERYCMFYPSFGAKKKECTFLVYGQAVSSWKEEFTISDPNEVIKEKIEKSIEFSNTFYTDSNHKHTPIDWVNVFWGKSTYSEYAAIPKAVKFYKAMEYKVSRSFFWNVIYKLVSDYFNIDRNKTDWSGKIIWSNLYKITGKKRNPDEKEQLSQRTYQLN